MNTSLLQSAYKSAKKLSLVAMLAIGLNGCGSGGSDDGSQFTVAPQTFDDVTLRLFSAFDLFFETTSTGGGATENGVFTYTQIQETFDTDLDVPGGKVFTRIATPDRIASGRYTYAPTSGDTAILTLTYSATFNDRSLFREQRAGNTNFVTLAEPHRILPSGTGTTTFEILFTANGSVITEATVRTQDIEVNSNSSTFTDISVNGGLNGTGTVDNTSSGISLSTGLVPVGFDPFVDPNAPLSIVPESLVNRTIVLQGSTPNLRIAFSSSFSIISPPSIPSVDFPDESGSILVTEDGTGTGTADGSYSYARTGGEFAVFAIQTANPNGGPTAIPTTLVFYTLNFDTLTYTGSDGTSGSFDDNGARS